jgi:hypothetical protein
VTIYKVPHKIGTALKTLYCRLMNKTLDDLTPSIRSFCLVNPEADFEMIMDFVDSQIAPFEADDELVDHAMEIMLECDGQSC